MLFIVNKKSLGNLVIFYNSSLKKITKVCSTKLISDTPNSNFHHLCHVEFTIFIVVINVIGWVHKGPYRSQASSKLLSQSKGRLIYEQWDKCYNRINLVSHIPVIRDTFLQCKASGTAQARLADFSVNLRSYS